MVCWLIVCVELSVFVELQALVNVSICVPFLVIVQVFCTPLALQETRVEQPEEQEPEKRAGLALISAERATQAGVVITLQVVDWPPAESLTYTLPSVV